MTKGAGIDESFVKYLAGLLDADGSLSFNFKRDLNRPDRYFLSLNLRLASSNAVDKHGFVVNLPKIYGIGSVSRYGKSSQFIAWNVSKRADLEVLLPRIIKHMVIKAKHWQWILDTWRETRAGRKTLSLEEREQLTLASSRSRRTNVGPLKPKNHPTWAWLAGYLDGDGTYSYRRYRVNGYIQWAIYVSAVAHINDILVLQFLEKSFGGQITDQGQSEGVKIWKRSLGYQNRDFALRFLPKLARHSRLKRHKIDAIIHHHRQRLSVPGTKRRYCEVEGCGRPRWGRGLCSMHYQRQRRAEVQATV